MDGKGKDLSDAHRRHRRSRTLICKSLKSNFQRGSFIAANFPATCNENFFLAFLVVAINLPTIVRQ